MKTSGESYLALQQEAVCRPSQHLVTGPRSGLESHGFGPPNTLTFTMEDVKAKVEKDGSEFGEIAIGGGKGLQFFLGKLLEYSFF